MYSVPHICVKFIELNFADEGQIETDLEKLTENKPSWLERIGELPPDALKAVQSFLPQLIGEMWFCTKSKRVRWFSSKSDMTFGIGLVGFDVSRCVFLAV